MKQDVLACLCMSLVMKSVMGGPCTDTELPNNQQCTTIKKEDQCSKSYGKISQADGVECGWRDAQCLSTGPFCETATSQTAGPTCDPFDKWPNVDNGVTCGDCTALVLTGPYGGRCDKYCESFGHVCTAANEERAEDCTGKKVYSCNQPITGTSDMLCTCRKPSAPPAPICDSFDKWPNVDNGVTCGGDCTALVQTSPYGGRCDKYCESFGHVCTGAYEEQSENCDVKKVYACNKAISGTSDMLCTCKKPSAPSVPICDSFDKWPNVDNGVTCGGNTCTALVKTSPYGSRCDKYCESFGHVVTGAYEEQAEDCQVKTVYPYNQKVAPGSSDMLCTCQKSAAKATCDPFDKWPNVDNGVTCGSCTALVLTSPYKGRCDKYCQSFGHVCTAAFEEQSENCDVKKTYLCNQPITGTSDMLCSCRKP